MSDIATESAATSALEEPMGWESAEPVAIRWTQAAFQLLNDGLLRVDVIDRSSVRSVTAQGKCPRCEDDVQYSEVLSVALPPTRRVRKIAPSTEEQVFVSVDIRCECVVHHQGRPPDRTVGCGILFAVETTVHVAQ
jgi:hypothetical protein